MYGIWDGWCGMAYIFKHYWEYMRARGDAIHNYWRSIFYFLLSIWLYCYESRHCITTLINHFGMKRFLVYPISYDFVATRCFRKQLCGRITVFHVLEYPYSIPYVKLLCRFLKWVAHFQDPRIVCVLLLLLWSCVSILWFYLFVDIYILEWVCMMVALYSFTHIWSIRLKFHIKAGPICDQNISHLCILKVLTIPIFQAR